jgi:hypothetical protein
LIAIVILDGCVKHGLDEVQHISVPDQLTPEALLFFDG